MALQNRVSPDGALHTSEARGMFTGNRGVIHDPETKKLLGRRWSTSAWICCALDWKGRKRDVWGHNYLKKDGTKAAGWTELFFLDEVTALAAGHRPCHTCRNKDAKRFSEASSKANGLSNASEKNRILHRERWHSSRTSPSALSASDLADLPDGVIIKSGYSFLAVKQRNFLPWDFNGYGIPIARNQIGSENVFCVTPPSIVETLRNGYTPHWHSTALENA